MKAFFLITIQQINEHKIITINHLVTHLFQVGLEFWNVKATFFTMETWIPTSIAATRR